MSHPLIQEFRKYNPAMSEDDAVLGLDIFKEQECQAKDIVLNIGEVCKHVYFVESSVTRCYWIDDEGEEQTLWMKPELSFITEYKSFVEQQPSKFGLQFYESTKVWKASKQDLLNLYKTNNNWALFGLALTESVHVKLIDVFVNLLANDATSNYRYIEYAFPRFIQVAPLKDIASMLQISQVSLSRIRAGNQLKS